MYLIFILYFFIIIIMEKREAIISAVNVRKDIDGTVLSYSVWVKEVWSKSDYTYRFEYWKASFEKTFWFSEESRLQWLVWQHCFITRSLTLK